MSHTVRLKNKCLHVLLTFSGWSLREDKGVNNLSLPVTSCAHEGASCRFLFNCTQLKTFPLRSCSLPPQPPLFKVFRFSVTKHRMQFPLENSFFFYGQSMNITVSTALSLSHVLQVIQSQLIIEIRTTLALLLTKIFFDFCDFAPPWTK